MAANCVPDQTVRDNRPQKTCLSFIHEYVKLPENKQTEMENKTKPEQKSINGNFGGKISSDGIGIWNKTKQRENRKLVFVQAGLFLPSQEQKYKAFKPGVQA